MNKVEVIKPKIIEFQSSKNENTQDIIQRCNGVPICLVMTELSFTIKEFDTAIRALLKADDKVIANNLPIELLDTVESKRAFLSAVIKVAE